MIEITFIILFVVAGFVGISYLHYKHILKLEILLKARDLPEAEKYLMKPELEVVKNPVPETLLDATEGKTAEEIREMFKVTPLNDA